MEGIAFTPVKLRNMTLNSRFVRSATELFDSTEDAHVREYEQQLYKRLGEHPIGMIITAHTCVSPEGRSNHGQNAIWSDDYIPDHIQIAQSIHSHPELKIKAVMQIGHGGMKGEGNNGGLKVLTPDNMTDDDISHVVQRFTEAAVRAKKCGFDGVELHCAHMYLLSQFFYPQYNHRTDKYGGSAENRIRITNEILQSIKKACGDGYPVLFKLNGDNNYNNDEYFNDVVKAANLLYDSGAEAIEVSGYNSSPSGKPDKPYFSETASKLAECTDLPVIQVGGIRTKEQVEEILSGNVKAVSFSRPFTCQQDLIEHMYGDGKVRCVSCNRCGGGKGRCVLNNTTV